MREEKEIMRKFEEMFKPTLEDRIATFLQLLVALFWLGVCVSPYIGAAWVIIHFARKYW